nr:RNA-directed DNA polymerase, eukaryota [Tanacetum cinerariifolium]
SFRRVLRGGAESHQLNLFTNLLDTVILSNMEDIWFFDLNGDGRFCVKDVRCLLDDVFLPKVEVPTRWIKSIPIKINIFAWKLCLDRLPTRVNLDKRNVSVASLLCPLCDFGFDQTQPPQFPVIHPPPQETSIKILHDHENVINSVQTFLRKFNRYSFFETAKVLLLAWDRIFKIKDALGTKQYKLEDLQELFRELSNDVQNIHEELAEYINTPGWNRPAFYDDDDDDDDVDYTIAITPVLSTEEPIDSLKVMEIVILKVGRIDDDILLTIKDDILHEKLLNVNLLITKIKAFNENPTSYSDCKTKSSSTSLNSLLEETNTFHNSLPEFENFYFDFSLSITIILKRLVVAVPLLILIFFLFEYDSFIFDLENDQFPPTDRSDFANKKFADELTHIISPPEYDCFYF